MVDKTKTYRGIGLDISWWQIEQTFYLSDLAERRNQMVLLLFGVNGLRNFVQIKGCTPALNSNYLSFKKEVREDL